MMKLMIVTAIKECRKDIAEIFVQNGVEIYSVAEIHGIHNREELSYIESWFGRNWEESHRSIMLFSFVKEETAQLTLKAIQAYNQRKDGQFPVKAVVTPVEMAVGFNQKSR